ncbi:MAG: DUF4150 domain-containing protein [bacterium]|nr:DUF4150 domain-containing protein [bacterium]
MGSTIFANGMEVSCKAGAGKTICAFPDVCFTPPQTPATPPGVPIPYPNTGQDSDTTDGTKKVKIGSKEVGIKNASCFKKSMGDEAGSAPKKGVVTSQNRGKVYFNSWSMDVKFEGKNAVRHLDLTTNNHASMPGDTPPWPFMASMKIDAAGNTDDPCAKEKAAVEEKCSPEEKWKDNCPTPPAHPGPKPKGAAAIAEYKAAFGKYMSEFPDFAKKCKDNPCLRARKCMLVPYKPDGGCCPGQTGDHVIDAASFLGPKENPKQPRNERPKIDGWANYDVDKAPCCCAEGPNQTTATHGQLHVRRGVVAAGKKTWPRKEAAATGAKAICKVFPDSACSQKCLEAQINKYHDEAQSSVPEKPINANASMTKDPEQRAKARADMFGTKSTR